MRIAPHVLNTLDFLPNAGKNAARRDHGHAPDEETEAPRRLKNCPKVSNLIKGQVDLALSRSQAFLPKWCGIICCGHFYLDPIEEKSLPQKVYN